MAGVLEGGCAPSAPAGSDGFALDRAARDCAGYAGADDPVAPGKSASRPEELCAARNAGLAGRFHSWRGLSGRRYVVTVYAPDAVPEYDEAVLLVVGIEQRGESGAAERVIRHAIAVEPHGPIAGDPRLSGAVEVHVHLLGRDAAHRSSIVFDLTGRI